MGVGGWGGGRWGGWLGWRGRGGRSGWGFGGVGEGLVGCVVHSAGVVGGFLKQFITHVDMSDVV